MGLPDSITVDNLLLNQLYHITYTVSDPEKRMDLYIDGKWTAFASVSRVQSQSVIFNNAPLYIGYDTFYNGITGQIRYIYINNICVCMCEIENNINILYFF